MASAALKGNGLELAEEASNERRFAEIDSAVGRLLLTSDGSSLTGLHFLDATHPLRVESSWEKDGSIFGEVSRQLEEYFAGARIGFDLRVALVGTAFQREVWNGLCSISYGETTSYGELAKKLGYPKAYRALGTANGHNPVAIIVPCHRVIASAGGLGGYGGGLDRKRMLLDLEARVAAR